MYSVQYITAAHVLCCSLLQVSRRGAWQECPTFHWAHKLPKHNNRSCDLHACAANEGQTLKYTFLDISLFKTHFGTTGKLWAVILYCLLKSCAESVQTSGNGAQVKSATTDYDSHNPQEFCSIHKPCLQPVLSWCPAIIDVNNAVPISKWHAAWRLQQLSCCSRETHSARPSSVTTLLHQAPCTPWLQEALNAKSSRHRHNIMLCKAGCCSYVCLVLHCLA